MNTRTQPTSPSRISPLTDFRRTKIFGGFSYIARPTAKNPEAIKIVGDWETRNIVSIPIPQLRGIQGAPSDGRVRFHRLAAKQFLSLWEAWEKSGLLKFVLSWDGSYVARFIRGSKSRLSNHAFGIAFDINAKWNRPGRSPAKRGDQGCVRDLVTLASEFGFFWGGHFSHPDGMHFEVARIAHAP